MNNVGIVYTPWDNLKKTNDMEVGQVGFHKQKEVYPAVSVFCIKVKTLITKNKRTQVYSKIYLTCMHSNIMYTL